MKCPYQLNTREQQITDNELTENGGLIHHDFIMIQTCLFVDCLKENCGAWHRGKCRYRGR